MRPLLSLTLLALLALGGCASVPSDAPQVTIVNSFSYDNAITGTRDGLRSAWVLQGVAGTKENYPLAQVKQCDKEGAACSWGVLKSERKFGSAKQVANGVELEFSIWISVERYQGMKTTLVSTKMKIPDDVPALQARRIEKRSLLLEYGKVARIDLDFGIAYEVCAQRTDAALKPLDECPVTFN